MKTFLISGIGGPTPRSIAKRVRFLFPDATIIGIDSNCKAIGFYLDGLLNVAYTLPRASEHGYWEQMTDIIEQHRVDIAFIQPEAEVIEWGKYFENYGSFPCPVLIPPLKYAENLVNKSLMSDYLKGTEYIPNTIRITSDEPEFEKIESEIGYPCWIRASVGSGGLGSLKLERKEDLEAWLFIHNDIREFTISEFLPGRHLANQMLYIDGKCIKNAGLECVEYVMADIAPSKVTGNTSFGRFINEPNVLTFCEECMEYIAEKLDTPAHGVFSFDLKEDKEDNLKVTEINVRHMAYTGVMAKVGFDLVADSITAVLGNTDDILNRGHNLFDQDYIFLRDVDIEPILMKEAELLSDLKKN